MELENIAREIIFEIQKRKAKNKIEVIKIKNEICGNHKIDTFPDHKLLLELDTLIKENKIKIDQTFKDLFQKRRIRTLSGISPISVLLPPGPCSSQCVYCPSERADKEGKTLFQKDTEKKYGKQDVPKKYQKPHVLVMPKSYISSEPGAMRALLAGFDPFLQIGRRLNSLEKTGHSADKNELIIQGGTFSDLPRNFSTRFVAKCYQAFNIHKNKNLKKNTSLAESQKTNEDAKHRVIGLTLETRPDCINEDEILYYRKLGCTRVELGVQTIDNDILRKIKRKQTREDVVRSTKLLRQAGFKICYHMMPNLPFSNPQRDLEVYREICNNSDFKPDLVKIYPCSVLPFSELQLWHKQGKYKPYSEKELYDILYEMKKITPHWIRISRLIRDIPQTAILGGNKITNLRQLIQHDMKKNGDRCRCIRCREVRDIKTDEKAQIVIREYEANGGKEYFIAAELKDETLLSMVRLRIDKNKNNFYQVLNSTGLIREVHSFGSSVAVGNKKNEATQHTGWGIKLIEKAEEITKQNGLKKMTVISGIGVKNYYKKLGFVEKSTYMVKYL